MDDNIRRFREWSREVQDLIRVIWLLDWDQAVFMPPAAVRQRSDQLKTLAGILHRTLTDPGAGEVLERVAARADGDPDLAADLRVMKRRRDRALKVPADLEAERARMCGLAQHAWERAREQGEFHALQPYLEDVVRLTREVGLAVDPEHPYDALLDDHEPGMTEAVVRPLFSEVEDRTRSLLARVQGSGASVSRDIFERSYPEVAQEAFMRRLAADLGFDFKAGRLDRSAHPFTVGSFRDVRMTTRYDPGNLATALFSTIHETGHALYEQGLDPDRERDPSGQSCSMGIHESQSRLWENLIGRSRAFWSYCLPRLKEAFPGRLDDVETDAFVRAANVVRPSLIRVEADELTYNLHVLLRFELEVALIGGHLAVADLPEAWGERTRQMLGLDPPDDRLGVLQDVHWSAGMFGYFPSYTLGNLYAAQFFEKLREEVPEVDDRIAQGEFGCIREWLAARIYREGRRHLPAALCERVTGRPLSVGPLFDYLERKLSDIYGF